MNAAGGAVAWSFIPAIGSPVLPIRQLMALEYHKIGLHSREDTHWHWAGEPGVAGYGNGGGVPCAARKATAWCLGNSGGEKATRQLSV